MAATRSTPGLPEQAAPTTPPAQVMATPTTPPGAPSKRHPAPPRTPPSQVTSTPRSPPGAPSGSPYTARRRLFRNNGKKSSYQKRTLSPTLSEMTSFLTVPPFTAPQIQFILWHLWTSTVPPATIAKMHNRSFPNLAPMTRWTVIDIDKDIATNWYAQGRSFNGMEPWSLLVPPGDADEWSCVCDFGVEDCWEYKRSIDGDGDAVEEDRERLCMAACLWDATAKQLVRCAHGRRKTERLELGKQEERGERKGGLRLRPIPSAVTAPVPRAEWVLLLGVLLVALLIALFNGWYGGKAG